MAGKPIIRRLIVCVDGTWYDADGREGCRNGNNSNIFRIYAAVKQGIFTDPDGRQIEQVAEYFSGVGTDTKPLNRFNDGITGKGCSEQVQKIFKYCCDNLQSPDDELWLYGFSRGAYVVRAVAGLLHHMSTISSKDEEDFQRTYKKTLDLLPVFNEQKHIKNCSGKLYHYFSKKARESPVIQFLGVFDTVTAVLGRSFEISYVDSTRHVRHAVALNDERKHFAPELYAPVRDPAAMEDRSMIQAWFVGAHADMGGGAIHDGLSLYPLQWMLIESKRYGLILEHNPGKRLANLIENPLQLAFPATRAPEDGISAVYGSQEMPEIWQFTYCNGIQVDMYDLRPCHDQGNSPDLGTKGLTRPRLKKDGSQESTTEGILSDKNNPRSGRYAPRSKLFSRFRKGSTSREKLEEEDGEKLVMTTSQSSSLKDCLSVKNARTRHVVRINRGWPRITFQAPREPFKHGRLQGYCETGPFGTIIHPSVYFLSNTYGTQGINSALRRFRRDISYFRAEQLPPASPDPCVDHLE